MHSLSPKSDKITRFSYRRELLKSKLKALCVVCNSFSTDVLHGILQQLFVPHVCLNQTVEACRVFHQCVKLGNRGQELWPEIYSYNYNMCANSTHHTNAAHAHRHTNTTTWPWLLSGSGKQTHSSSSTNCFTSSELNDLVPMETRFCYIETSLGNLTVFF